MSRSGCAALALLLLLTAAATAPPPAAAAGPDAAATPGATAPAGAAVRDDRGKRYHARRSHDAPRIDGRLEPGEWRGAVVDDRFTQNFPQEGRPASERTELYVLYDDEALYVAVRAFDSDPAGIVERLTRRDRDTDADKITVDISSKNDRTTAYHFDVNCAGVLADGVRFDDTNYSGDWDGLWLGAAHRDAHGWTAELQIPFKTLRYEGGRSEFGLQVRRYVQRKQEVDEWALVPRTARGEVSYYGVLDGLAGLRTARLFQLVPYLAAGIYLRYNQAPYDGSALYGNLGVDFKLGLTPALTLDATINPDFGQVEADQVVFNLSTFEVFFPEKRPFFLEGVDIFATPIQLFYSRRIGRPPPEPNGYDQAEPLPTGRIWGAVKLSGLLASRLTIGVLDALTDSSAVDVIGRAPGQRMTLGLQPLSNFFVARLKRDILAHSYVGVLVTGVTRFEQPFAEAPLPGDLCPEDPIAVDDFAPSPRRGRCTHDAYAGGVDAFLTSHDGTYNLRAHATGSAIVGGPTRVIADGTRVGAGDTGAGLVLNGGKVGGRFNTTLRYEGYSPAYDINDVGYNRQANLHSIHSENGWRILKPTSILLEGNAWVGFNLRSSWSGDAFLSKNVFFYSWWHFKNYWFASFELDYDWNHDDNREARDGAIVERVGGWSGALWFKTDPRKRFVFEFQGVINPVRHGQWLDGTVQLHLRPIPAVEVDLIPHAAWVWGDPRWYDTRDNADGTRTYYFGDLDSKELDVTLRGTYTFTPTLTLQAYAQLFVDGGHYGNTTAVVGRGKGSYLPLNGFRPAAMPAGEAPDFRDGALNVNVVLRWEFRPGSTILGVYTHAQQQLAYDPMEGIGRINFGQFGPAQGTDLFLVKLSLLLL